MKLIDFSSILMGVCFSIIWSSAFTSARILMMNAPPFMVLSARFLISGFLGIIIAIILGQKIDLTKQEWFAIFSIGVCQNSLYLGLNFVALQWIGANMAVIIASLLPLVVAAFSWVILGEKLSIIGTVGIVLGISGVLVIMIDKTVDQSKFVGIFLCSLALLALVVATILIGNAFSNNKNLMIIISLQMLVGCIVLLPFTIIFEKWFVNLSALFIIAFSYQILMSGLLGTLIWFLLVKRIGATKAAAFHFLNPFFGVLIAAAILAEPLSFRDCIGVVIIMVGILVVQIKRLKK